MQTKARRRSIDLLLALLGVAACARQEGLPPAGAASHRFPLQACRVEGVEEDLLCGTLEVFENRGTRSGRKIPLNVVLIPALSGAPRPDPIFDIAGGPGVPSTMAASYYAAEARGYRRDRDVVLVDQRGTGKSNLLQCDLETEAPNPRGLLDEMYPPEAVAACREELSKKADLTLYTTPIAMDDLDDVRAWLGFDRINLNGLSYGTRAALVYVKRHPDRVRSAVLMGVAPTNMKMPLHHARDAQRAMRLLFEDCASDAACRGAFPRLQEELAALLGRLDRQPARAAYTFTASGESVQLQIQRGVFAERIRNILYAPNGARLLPMIIHQAFQGDFQPFLHVALEEGGGPPKALAEGMYLSVTCAEDTRLIDPAEAKRLDEGTFLGDYRVFQQTRACSMWPAATLPRDYWDPVVSDVPVLMITGYLDPITPPSWAAEAVRRLPNSRNVLLRYGGHLPDGLGNAACLDGIILGFIDRGTADGLDTSCVETMTPPPFALRP